MPEPAPTPLSELARLFLKLGCIAFGGPAAHVAMMEDEVVRRRKWLAHEEFLDLLGATNLIPGPNSTEMTMHIGRVRAGWKGLVVAGACFIFPAFVIVTALAWALVRYGEVPQVEAVLYGVKPVVIAIVIQALWGLAGKALKSRWLWGVFLAAIAANALGANELIVLVAGGLAIGLPAAWISYARKTAVAATLLVASTVFLAAVLWGIPFLLQRGSGGTQFSTGALFYYFLKIGSVLYGSGYVLLAFLEGDLVGHLQWLTESQLLDAVAVGQVTPGPVFTTATFIGFLLAGVTGAAIATAGIFLPSFLFVAASGPLIPKIRRSAAAGAFLDGVNAAALALMAVVSVALGRAAIVDGWTAAIALCAAIALIRFRLNSLWLVALGMAAGLLKMFL